MKSLYRECLALGVEADSEDAVYLFAESALYMLGSTGAFDFQKHIKHLCKNRSAKVFRLRLCDNHIALSMKLYLMHLSLTRPTSYMAKKLSERFDVEYGWNGDVLNFARSGVDGKIALSPKQLHVTASLGFLLSALKGPIEAEIRRVLDEKLRVAARAGARTDAGISARCRVTSHLPRYDTASVHQGGTTDRYRHR